MKNRCSGCQSKSNPPVQAIEATETTSAKFQKIKAKIYVPVVTLSINDKITFLEKIN